jgi:aminoglycoside phosphotransferase (APT) family kinase protein
VDDIAAFRNRLAAAARRHLGGNCDITAVTSLSSGASAQTWRASLRSGGIERDIIVQVMADETPFDGALKRSAQAAVQAAVRRAGGPVAPVLFVLDEADGLGDGFAMERIEGETLAPRILRQEEFAAARRALAQQCGAALAQIHATPLDLLPQLERRSARSSVDQLEATVRRFNADLPAFEVAFQWLRVNTPAEQPPVLVHGDFRLGNLIIGTEGLRAVLDWELTHVGDAAEDLAFISLPAWRFGQLDRPVGGFGERAAFYSAYEAAGGRTVDPAAIRFWEVFGTLKWGTICLFFAGQQARGEARALERAVIGRRVAETELDLLLLMEEA